ncbi:MAG TPA: hypothetical protein VMZ53_15965 [Kofleriaceae bacterium]|nr:hypothetical protein [Kofleriaceae bacterium]
MQFRPTVIALLLVEVSCGRRAFELHDAARDGAPPPIDAITPDAVSRAGCADDTREAFLDEMLFPEIAGCAATWNGTPSMRAPRTGSACGNGAVCAVPADACGDGWHVCEDSGNPADLSTRVSGADCHTGGGVATGTFITASSHCSACANGCAAVEVDCVYAPPYGCAPTTSICSESVCCGPDCYQTHNCHGAVFAAPDTWINGAFSAPCGAMPGNMQTGVLCCRDPAL